MKAVVIHPALSLVAPVWNTIDFRTNHLFRRIKEQLNMISKALDSVALNKGVKESLSDNATADLSFDILLHYRITNIGKNKIPHILS